MQVKVRPTKRRIVFMVDSQEDARTFAILQMHTAVWLLPRPGGFGTYRVAVASASAATLVNGASFRDSQASQPRMIPNPMSSMKL